MWKISRTILKASIVIFIALLVGTFTYKNHYSNASGEQNNSSSEGQELRLLNQLNKDYGPFVAIKKLESRIQKSPDDAVLLYQIAMAKFALATNRKTGEIEKTGDSEKGLGYLRRALKIDPNKLSYNVAYATVLSDMGYTEEAATQFEKLFSEDALNIRVDKKYRYLVTNYAIALEKLGQTQKGLDELKKSIVKTGYDPQLSYAYIYSLGIAGQVDSLDSFYKSYERNKGYNRKVKYSLCNTFEKLRMYKDARNCFKEMIKVEKKDIDYTRYLTKRYNNALIKGD